MGMGFKDFTISVYCFCPPPPTWYLHLFPLHLSNHTFGSSSASTVNTFKARIAAPTPTVLLLWFPQSAPP